jgi:hypothetical protein
MSSSTSLVMHKGARLVTREQLAAVDTPEPTNTWFPVPHVEVYEAARTTLQGAGFEIERAQLALSRNDARFFATLDLRSSVADGVSLAVGVRNSIDKSLPIGFCGGNRVFVCDNLAFSSEIMVRRKHTRFGQERFEEAMARAISSLAQFQETERARIERARSIEVRDETADSIILRAYEDDVISTRSLDRVIKEWREPTHEEFAPRTLWSLENAFTGALGDMARTMPQKYAGVTMRLQRLLAQSQEPPLVNAV